MEAVVPFGLSKRKRESALSLSSTVSIVENLKVADMTMGDNQTSMKRTKSIVSRSNDSLPITIPEKDACDVDKKESLPSFSASSKCEIAMSPGSRERESKRRVVEGDVKGDSAGEAPDLHSEQRQVKDTHDISVYSDEGFCQETCASVLPDPDTDASPDEYLLLLTKALIGKDLEAKPALSLDSFFYEVTEEQMAAYTMEVVNSVRNNDLVLLKKLHQEGQALDCFNRFGESLLNMACRRGFESIAITYWKMIESMFVFVMTVVEHHCMMLVGTHCHN